MAASKAPAGKAAARKARPATRAKVERATGKVADAKPQAAPAAPGAAPARATKTKLVRDSFTIPKSEYALLEGLKLRAAELRRPTKKSEVLRAGIAALHQMGDKAFLAALVRVPSLKTGRPKSQASPSEAKARGA